MFTFVYCLIQPTQLYIKSADLMHAIEPIGQGIFRPLRLIRLLDIHNCLFN